MNLVRHSIRHQDQERTFLVHLPQRRTQPTPLVVVFHGAGTTGEAMIEFTGMGEKAEQEGFVVAYPNGTGRMPQALTWNCGGSAVYAARQGIDDVGFVHRMLDWLRQHVQCDRRRTFAMGMSNGAAMCYRLAAELPGTFSAITAVAGCLVDPPPRDATPTSVIHFHGTADEFAPYAGGIGRQSLTRTPMASVAATIQAWVRINGCQSPPSQTTIYGKKSDEPVICDAYQGGRDGTRVVLYKIPGGGHTWPGRVSPYHFLGKSTDAVQATDLAWSFFMENSYHGP
jgi:polyhydroxybutyrate depolymerase